MSAGVSPPSNLPPTVVPDTPVVSASRPSDSAMPPALTSITPPPSTQIPVTKHVVRTPSPITSHLNSPPPTNRVPVPTSHTVVTSDLPTPDQVSHASVEDLRRMVDHLSIAVRKARTDAAHYKLQHNMLLIDSSETSKRMEVELQLTQREVEVLQEAEERRRSEYMSPAQQAGNAALIGDLNRHCLVLQNENDAMREVLTRTATDLEDREGQLLTLTEENQRLRHRIRMNREHMNGILDLVSDGSPRSLMGTPHRTPRHAAPSRAPIMSSQGREPNTFDALLLADKVLHSQETATAPSTPKTTPLRHRGGHTRNTHSLSSLPSTPVRRALHPTASQLRTPPHLTTITEPHSQGSLPLPPLFAVAASLAPPTNRRRASSDSTITASSVEDGDNQMSGSDDDIDEIPESQASQVATSMLRHTPKSSQKGKLNQTRILGKVTKSTGGGEKRMISYSADVQGSPTKKGRVGKGAVGLGIGM